MSASTAVIELSTWLDRQSTTIIPVDVKKAILSEISTEEISKKMLPTEETQSKFLHSFYKIIVNRDHFNENPKLQSSSNAHILVGSVSFENAKWCTDIGLTSAHVSKLRKVWGQDDMDSSRLAGVLKQIFQSVENDQKQAIASVGATPSDAPPALDLPSINTSGGKGSKGFGKGGAPSPNFVPQLDMGLCGNEDDGDGSGKNTPVPLVEYKWNGEFYLSGAAQNAAINTQSTIDFGNSSTNLPFSHSQTMNFNNIGQENQIPAGGFNSGNRPATSPGGPTREGFNTSSGSSTSSVSNNNLNAHLRESPGTALGSLGSTGNMTVSSLGSTSGNPYERYDLSLRPSSRALASRVKKKLGFNSADPADKQRICQHFRYRELEDIMGGLVFMS